MNNIMNLKTEDLEYVKKLPCPEHPKLVSKINIVMYLIMFDILTSIVNGENLEILIPVFMKLVKESTYIFTLMH